MVVYGRNAVREAVRGRRRVHASGPRRHAVPRARPAARRVHRGAGRHRGPLRVDAHQGICAEVDPYPYAGAAELLRAESPLLVALDEVTDPQNLGAVCRSAECAGPRA
jgi:23S rRNA (guanosine2251-2'-O)-methyltransferase